MFKVSNETKVGVFGALAITMLIIGYSFLKGEEFFKEHMELYSVYDNVSGLVETNAVLINGYRIGQISKLELIKEGDDKGKILATLYIKEIVGIPKNSIAKIISADILGARAIEIVIGDGELTENHDMLVADSELNIQEAVNAQIKPVKIKAENLLASMDSVLTLIKYVFNKNARANIERSFETINNSLMTFQHTAHSLDALVSKEKEKLSRAFDNLESITSNLQASNEKITRILNNAAELSDTLVNSELKSAIASANKVFAEMSEIAEKVNKGEGTIAKLLHDKEAYDEFANAMKDLKKLLSDIRLNPDRYVHFSIINIGGGGKNKGKEQEESTDN